MITTHTRAGEGGTYVIDLTIAQGSSTASLNTFMVIIQVNQLILIILDL